jgi:hypothetical protein
MRIELLWPVCPGRFALAGLPWPVCPGRFALARFALAGLKDQVALRSNAADWYLADELNADQHFVGVRPYRWTSEANWSERQDSNLRLHPSKGCRLATDLLSDGALSRGSPGGNRIPASRLRKPNAASSSEGNWSE